MPIRDTALDIDTGSARIKFSTLAAILAVVISGAVGAVTWGVNTATKSDLKLELAAHSKAPHHVNGAAVSAPASVVPQVASNTRAVGRLEASVEELHEKIDDGNRRAQHINARIEFLIEREIFEAQGDPAKRSAVRRAVRNVRARQHLEDEDRSESFDPFGSIDGL